MRNLAIVSVASLMIASAYAMPSENANGAHSYSYQGKAVSVKVLSHNRNIPAPSSWTPPERIPTARVTMVARIQPKKVGGGFSMPTFTNPTSNSPTFTNPSFSSPNFTNPNSSSPAYSNPATSSPNFTSPNSASPTLSSPVYNSPSYSL